ncbi:MAG: PP2C family protein-serine/threonine phosphatase, partial [Rhodothermales bacterium]|nr:PP2C family protein-serine/threonine phosphatase [Rhodothermales bacterium]
EVWPEKLRMFDGLFSQRFLFRDLGRSALRGASLAGVQLGLFYTVTYGLVHAVGAWPIVSEGAQQVLSAFIPVGLPLGAGILNAILATAYAFLFALAILKKRTGRTWIAVTITAIVFSFLFVDYSIVLERWYTGVAGIIAALAAYFYFLRYDLGTVFFGQLFASALPVALTLLSQPAGAYRLAGLVALATFALMLAAAVVLTYRGRELDERSVQPRYVQFISERERLKLELDIARKAQLRMLPRTVPDTKGLDIAAYSEPAREVGGDYFDFFRLGQERLGVAIGDVSGKGMPAALYMTMLKGFLQSQANSGASPRAILSSTNRYFHASAESSTFITLLFCVFDLASSDLTFARAGHYPLLVHRPDENMTTILQPPGIGIGLEEGDVFDRVIREESIGLQPGDVVVLFTDGLTEARNPSFEEFGQDRIRTVLQQIDGQSAEQILNAIRNTYEVFRGGQDAHDDFSCVVVRVT